MSTMVYRRSLRAALCEGLAWPTRSHWYATGAAAWRANQLRHAAATRIRSIAGVEMARAVLWHTTMAVTDTYYAEAHVEKAAELMAKIG